MGAKPPKRVGRPRGTGLPPGERKVAMQVRLGPADLANLALARRIFGVCDNSKALRRALQLAVWDAGHHAAILALMPQAPGPKPVPGRQ
jgi:hypothetical protein